METFTLTFPLTGVVLRLEIKTKKTGLFDQDGKRQISSQSKHCGGCVWDEVLLRLCEQNVVTLLDIPSGTEWNEN